MTLVEQLFLALVLLSFFTFGVTLAIVSSRTNSYLRWKAAREAGAQSSLKKAA